MPNLDQKIKVICSVCGVIFDVEATSLSVKHRYCYACKEALKVERNKRAYRREKRKVVVKETQSVIRKNSPVGGRLIQENIDWFRAGMFCGKQGYLRERFYSLLSETDDFLEAKNQIQSDKKWLAELDGLSEKEGIVWLIGFFKGINGDIPEEFQRG
jgi:hypothetical protein